MIFANEYFAESYWSMKKTHVTVVHTHKKNSDTFLLFWAFFVVIMLQQITHVQKTLISIKMYIKLLWAMHFFTIRRTTIVRIYQIERINWMLIKQDLSNMERITMSLNSTTSTINSVVSLSFHPCVGKQLAILPCPETRLCFLEENQGKTFVYVILSSQSSI